MGIYSIALYRQFLRFCCLPSSFHEMIFTLIMVSSLCMLPYIGPLSSQPLTLTAPPPPPLSLSLSLPPMYPTLLLVYPFTLPLLPLPLSPSLYNYIYLLSPSLPLQGAWTIIQPRAFNNSDGSASYSIPTHLLDNDITITSCSIQGCYNKDEQFTEYLTNRVIVNCSIGI